MKIFKKRVVPVITSSTKDYKTPIKEILSYSSLSYILSPIRSKRLLIKIIWILFLIGFFFASVYYVALNVLDFLKYETTTSIFTINEQEAEFPTISFCHVAHLNFDFKMLELFFQSENLTDEWQNHFESYTDTAYGKCYRFNSGFNLSNQSILLKKKRKGGLYQGLWFQIFSNASSYFGNLIISIDNHTQIPVNIYHKGYSILPGTINFFSIKRIYDKKLELPYNNCYKNVSKSEYHNQTIIDYLNEKKREYRQKECLHLCDKLKFKEINPCNFSLNDLDEDIYYKVFEFGNQTIFNCIEAFFNEVKHHESCSTLYCPLECDSFTCDISWTSQTITGYGNISSFEKVSKSFFGIRVYYEDLKYTSIEQQPKIELFGLISNVGGTLGLLLGFSFISLLEIFEVLAELVYIKFH
jgi:hypothetical protein